MTRRRLWTSLLCCVGITVALLLVNIGLGNTPALGLDLQGGVSVVLAPESGASGDDLIVIRDLIRDELENRGIGEPDVHVEGSNIIVDLPGVKDQQDALDAVDVAGIVTLRPVLGCVAAPEPGATTTTVAGATTTTVAGSPGTLAGATSTTTVATTTSAAPAGFRRPAQTIPPTTTPTTTPGTTTPTTPPTTGSTVAGSSTTLPTDDIDTATTQDGSTILRTLDGRQCLVGPPGAAGDEVFNRDSAEVQLSPQQGWTVLVGLSGSGESAWNALAAECYNATETCPTGQLAIVLDDVIQSDPVVREPRFSGEVSISGSFSEDDARSLSRVLNRGAFPAKVEAKRVDTVSPTLGKDSLEASIVAGLVGIALLVLILVLFYRRLTLLIALGMIVWGMLIYSVAVFISQTSNYALTLAGVTGIIVSIGMTVDSYVVYFERMKDEVLHGRTFKNSAARSFRSTWRTILAANLVSLIAATVLFVLSVGSVRGFALYLGVTTVCDVVVLWFFTRPAVILLAEAGRLDGHDPFGLGPMPQPAVATEPPPAPAPGGGAS